MGKSIIQQARGKGSLTYQVRSKAYIYRIGYPRKDTIGEAKVIALLNSTAHSAPLARIQIGKEIFYNVAVNNLVEGQTVAIGGSELKQGNIIQLKEIPTGSEIFNIERYPGDGGKIIRSSGSSAIITRKVPGKVYVMLPSKKEIEFDENCRATIGKVAGAGRLEKPFVKAGKKHYLMKSKNKLWPRTSAVKFNAVDHPFGSGRGKRIKPKIPKRNAPPGAKVGTLRPRRTGRKKR
jgi:large subunit ribosomal protein L2